MKKLRFIVFACLMAISGIVCAQNYDTVSGATQKADGKSMSFEQFKKALDIKEKKLIFSTVNEDGTPNSAVYGSFNHIEDKIFAVNSMGDSKTTKINVNRTGISMLLLVLDEKTEDGFDGAKVVLKLVKDASLVSKYRSKMEKSSEKTTFFSVQKFLIYR